MNNQFTDPRDGQTYKAVKIGNKIWMAENLRFAGVKHRSVDGDSKNDAVYGFLYEWEEALKACPPGWHLPTEEEFFSLLADVGADQSTSSENLRATTWGNSADEYGFGALPAGGYYHEEEAFYLSEYLDGHYFDFGNNAYFWSSTEDGMFFANLLVLDSSSAFMSSNGKTNTISVRCIKD